MALRAEPDRHSRNSELILSVNKHLLSTYYTPGMCEETRSLHIWLSVLGAIRENDGEVLFHREWFESPLAEVAFELRTKAYDRAGP